MLHSNKSQAQAQKEQFSKATVQVGEMFNFFGLDVKFEQVEGRLALSTPEQLKSYFMKILEFTRKGDKFPVDLDDVWPLIYSRKEEAVRALVSNNIFVKGFDYQVLRKDAENPKGGRPTQIYTLSVQCLEYFIVRKKREVFEVYRQIFHAVANGKFQKPRKTPKGVARLPYSEEEKQVLEFISNNLIEGDLAKIAKGAGFSPSLVCLVVNGKHVNEKVVKEAYRVALDNQLQGKKEPDSIYEKGFVQDCLATINLFNQPKTDA